MVESEEVVSIEEVIHSPEEKANISEIKDRAISLEELDSSLNSCQVLKKLSQAKEEAKLKGCDWEMEFMDFLDNYSDKELSTLRITFPNSKNKNLREDTLLHVAVLENSFKLL